MPEKKKEMKEKPKIERKELGMTADKDDFSEWFTQLMIKAELADYTEVSGCMVLRPYSYAIWERVVSETDKRFKKVAKRRRRIGKTKILGEVARCYFVN